MIQAHLSTTRRWLKKTCWGILLLIIVALGGLALSNLLLPSRSMIVDRLSDLDKARVAEAFHLRGGHGNNLWEGWGIAEIPLILYNEEYAFLAGCSNPPPGWTTVPQKVRHGGAWEIVPGDLLDGKHYYRQRLPDKGATPQAFTVRVGESWVASMTTQDWTAIAMGNEIRDAFPSLLRPFVPYRLAARIFLGLAMDTDGYICAIGHESFHAFQGIVASVRIENGENALAREGKRYPWNDRLFNEGWKAELNLLADALLTKDDKHMIELGQKFIALRKARRLSFNLDTNLVDLERLREWEEGLAKYTELALWKCASAVPDNGVVPVLGRDPDFKQYKGFSQRWTQEIITLRMQSGAGEIRFYYSGMAQGFMLDRLLPGWRSRILRDNLFLEDLLSEAVGAGRALIACPWRIAILTDSADHRAVPMRRITLAESSGWQ
jgi:hypothetical protein